MSKSDAFFNSAWCFNAPSAPYTSSSCSPSTSSSSSLLVPPTSLGRRASDSALPPPCALDRPALFRSRLASSGSIQSPRSSSIPSSSLTNRRPLSPLAGQRGQDIPVASTSAGPSSQCSAAASSSTSSSSQSTVSEMERRLEAAVRDMETKEVDKDDNVLDADNEDDDDDMYYNDPQDAASTIDRDSDKPFLPLFPLQPLATTYIPQHRLLVKPLRQALRALVCATAQSVDEEPPQKRRCVSFADYVEVVDVFAAADYVGRRGPPPIERLTMRDILELRQIKIELGVHGKNDPNAGNDDDLDGTPSTPFEKMNILESTPLSPSSSLGPPSPFRTDFTAAFTEASAGTNTSSAASSFQSGISSTSLSVSTSSSSYFDSAASSCVPSETALHAQQHEDTSPRSSGGMSASIVFLDPKASHLLRERSRETSPDSIGANTLSAFSSPSLSLSCSPSASDSEFFYSTEGDERDNEGSEEQGEDEYSHDGECDQQETDGTDPNETLRVAEFGHARKSVRLKSATPPRRRSRNADYFKVSLPVLSRCSTTDSSDLASSEVKETVPVPMPVVVPPPVLVLDGPWGLGS